MLLRIIALVAVVLAAIVGLPLGIFEDGTWAWAYPVLAVGFLLLGLVIGFLYLYIACARVDLATEQEIDDPHYRKITELYADFLIPSLRISVKTTGLSKVPKDRRFLLICNHCSNADPILLLRELSGYQIAFISKKENQKLFVIGPMMHKILCQPLDRDNDREALKTILKCIKILKENKASIGVFPEGGISKPDRKLHRFRPGVFKIAQKAQVPIVVCTLKGTKHVIPNMARYRHSDVELSVLTVIEPEELADVSTADIAERTYQLMAADLGPENVAEE